MTIKPQHASGYDTSRTRLVRETCLDLATRLGGLMDDLVVVGGMVPGLIVPQDPLPRGVRPHCGTLDIDLGLAVAMFEERRYQSLTDRLRASGFEPDRLVSGAAALQRWRVADDHALTIDFLVAPSSPGEAMRGGKLRHIESDFAAIVSPGLHLAFADRLSIPLAGVTRKGEQTERVIPVCGPAAFVALKALAFRERGVSKDAYDLYYVLRNYGGGVDDIIERFDRIRGDADTERALSIIEADFTREHSIGPMRVSDFLHARVEKATLADVAGFSREFLSKAGRTVGSP
ncbi:MAG: nucleotidyl transferase AbiEii/AbiGii toxin family protein [Candidatus Eisenbacteria bacterium]|nr:nucleotidyl transferase AbiEii/AbiGii toxin family protein [Candidatus Eisenbacteria bacterium]